MTLYKYTVPIKCSTIHHIKNKIFDALWKTYRILLLLLIGILNGLVFYIFFHMGEISEYVISNGGIIIPGGEYSFMVVIIIFDMGLVVHILDECDVQIKLDCIRSEK